MPAISYQASIDVRAPAEVTFAILAGDIVATRDDPNAIGGQRPLVEGPLRDGFVWQQTYVHNRHVCRTYWTISELHAGRALTQSMHHLCMDSGRETRGGERWEIAEADEGSTVVTLSAWRLRPGLAGWVEKLFDSRIRTTGLISLRIRLSAVQFRAEHPSQPVSS
jgi:hypothetical protein